jgi:hypothetical protein
MRAEYADESSDQVLLVLTRQELALLVGSANEALEAVEDWEFDTRLGVTKDEARRISRDVHDAYRSLKAPPQT